MRFGGYEILRSNQWCYQVYQVMPDGFDNSKKKYRKADDGRFLKPLDCYPNTLAQGVRRIAQFTEKDASDTGCMSEVFERLERLRSEIENAAAKLGDA